MTPFLKGNGHLMVIPARRRFVIAVAGAMWLRSTALRRCA